MTNNEIKIICDRYILLCDKYKNSYFFNINMSASMRRAKEKSDYLCSEFTFGKENIKILFSLNISCNNCYVTKEIFVDNKSKDVRFIKKLLTRLDIKKDRRDKINQLDQLK